MPPSLSILILIFVNIIFISCQAENRNEFQNGEFQIDSNPAAFIKVMGPLFGFPRILANEKSDPLLSETEVKEMLDLNWTQSEQHFTHKKDHCARDLGRVAFSLRENWAQSMIDADGKIPPGILLLNLNWVGSYRECLAVQAPPDPLYNNKSDTTFGGKYCTATWKISSQQGSIGLCIPDTCEESDFKDMNISQHIFIGRNIIPQLLSGPFVKPNISISSLTCLPETTPYSNGAIVVLVIIYIFVLLVATGTFLTAIESYFPFPTRTCHAEKQSINSTLENGLPELIKEPEVEERSETAPNYSGTALLIPTANNHTFINQLEGFLKCFCLITNGAKILDTKDKGDGELRCIHGIRFLSMAWVILGHTYVFSFMSTLVGNMLDVLNLLDNPASQVIFEGTYSVDSFFVMSGFLLTHIFLREMTAKEGKISWLAFYLHRFWRLTPVYMMVLAFDMTLSLDLISGPIKPPIMESGCTKSWWWNLLYINNFAPSDESCMGWSWYLANDMQFYVISPLFLYPLWRWPIIGLGIIATLFCSSWITTFVISYHYDVIAAYTRLPKLNELASFTAKTTDYFDKIYVKPYTRINPYLIGVVIAYLLFRLNGRKNFLNRTIQLLGWTISTGIGLLMVIGLYNTNPSRVGTAFYNAVNRSVFSACLGWVIFACLTGHGDPVNKILSHSIFVPLGRLTYCAYLVHPIIMTVYYMSLPTTLIITHLQMVTLFFGFLIFSYGVAFATSLLFESPTMTIEKFLRKKPTSNNQTLHSTRT